MTAQPGDEPGNVVAWKDFKRLEGSRIYAKSENFHIQSGKLTMLDLIRSCSFQSFLSVLDGFIYIVL